MLDDATPHPFLLALRFRRQASLVTYASQPDASATCSAQREFALRLLTGGDAISTMR